MLCPICNHVTEIITDNVGRASKVLYWCPRCGTNNYDGEEDESPMLVRHCRALIKVYETDERISELLRVFSITESVTKENE